MYGWRARIGLVIPANNTVIEPECSKIMPLGVSAFGARIRSFGLTAEGIEKMVENSHRAVEELAVGGMDVIAYACLATSLVKGENWTQNFQEMVQLKTGKPVFTAAHATLDALHNFGVSRVALATPYPDSINNLLYPLFKSADIEIVALKNVTVKNSLEVCRLPPLTAYRLAKEADHEKAEAICVLATDFRSIESLKFLEEDLGKPAISTNQALMWRCLRACRISDRISEYGSLLQKQCVPVRSNV